MPLDRRSSPGRRALLWALPALAIAVLVTVLTQSGGRSTTVHPPDPKPHQPGRIGPFAPASPADPGSVRVTATVPGTVRAPLPRSFLGLSFEYWDVLPLDAHPAILRRVFELVRVRGDGPVVLRIGGDSADQAYWGRTPDMGLGPWPFHVTTRWLRRLAALVRASHLRVLLDLNLAERAPGMAARFARAALRRLPPGSVSAFEIGNEPDIYHHWVDYHLRGRSALFVAPTGWDEYSPARYAHAFNAYARALARVVPRVPLAGPESAYPQRDLSWERRLLASDESRVSLLTVHRYPLSACARPDKKDFSTIARTLSPDIAAGLQPGLASALRLAHETDLPLRMTEFNSVTCEGRRGVSNTFAAALWAPDALFSLWKAGLSGVNIHDRQDAANAAFSMSREGLVARPLLYGLALFARTLGHRGHLARLRVGHSARSVRLWAVRSGRRLNVLVLDKGPHPAHVRLRVPSRRPAVVQRLTAPSVRATSGVRLAGQTLSASGRWVGRRALERLRPGPGRRYRLDVPAYSAALVTFRR